MQAASEETKQAAASQAATTNEEEKKEEEDTGPVAPKHVELANEKDGANGVTEVD